MNMSFLSTESRFLPFGYGKCHYGLGGRRAFFPVFYGETQKMTLDPCFSPMKICTLSFIFHPSIHSLHPSIGQIWRHFNLLFRSCKSSQVVI
jgi:hypothetical protein